MAHIGREKDIERGLTLVPELGEVMADEADEVTRRIYEDIRNRLRVPLVNFIFRVLAHHPAYLDLSWSKLAPYLLTREFELVSDALRVRALPDPAPQPAGKAWAGLGDLDSIRSFTDTIHYVLPKLLLIVSAFDEGLGDTPGHSGRIPEEAVRPGVAEGTFGLPMVAPEATDATTQALLEDIRSRHGHPGVPSYYRGVAQWPDFLSAAWANVAPFIGSAAFEESKRGLLEEAREAAGRLPLAGREEALDAGVDDSRIEQLRAVLAIFRFRVIPETFVEVALIKSLLDGPGAARVSRFSFAAN